MRQISIFETTRILTLEDLKKFIFTEEGLTEERGGVVDESLNLLLD